MRKTWYMVALAVLTLASCSNEVETTGNQNDGKTPILLGTGVSTKAPVNAPAGLNDAGIGIFGITTANTTAATTVTAWDAAVILNNVKPQTVKDGNIELPIPYYYPATEEDYVKFMAFHPYAAKGTEGQNYLEVSGAAAPVYHFTLSGQEDLMCATPAIGNKLTTSSQNLEFAHKLTQITFKVIRHTDMESKLLDVTGIQFAAANTTGKMNIETGAISDWATPSAITAFNGKVAIPAASTNAAAVAGAPVMLQPGEASFSLNVATSAKTFENVIVKPTGDASFLEGKSYEVTLTFNLASVDPAKQIQLSASVKPWTTGGEGSGTVE